MMFVQRIILTICVFSSTNGFNFSPKPNLIFKKRAMVPDEESSYFGYSINLRESSIIVGAPRQAFSLDNKSNKTGAIYRCLLKDPSKECYYYPIPIYKKSYIINDGQWLGATIDGGFKESSNLVVCAPRLIRKLNRKDDDQYRAAGICHFIQNTLSDHPNVTNIVSLLEHVNRPAYINGVLGMSVHLTRNTKEILIGGPNAYDELGCFVSWNTNTHLASITFSHRLDTSEYLGYSVHSGNFNTTLPDDVQYIASAPHARCHYGQVNLFGLKSTIRNKRVIRTETKIYHRFNGTEYGAFFGYTILAEDFNNDGLSDVIISAPMYTTGNNVDQGAVFVYISKGNFSFELQQTIVSPIENGSRFGTTISRLGDINGDGYNDVAIGAPFAGDGAVFIYLGNSKGLSLDPSQKLTISHHDHIWGPILFGHGLSNGYDIDNNGFNDFVVGAPNAESVYVFRAYAVVKIHLEIRNLSRKIKKNQNNLEFSLCFKILTTSKKIKEQNITIDLDIDPNFKRVSWEGIKSGKLTLNKTATLQIYCHNISASLNVTSIKPIQLSLGYNLIDVIPDTEDFCEKCAVLDPNEPRQIIDTLIFIYNVNLRVQTLELNRTLIIGSRKTLNITYEVYNSGDKAFEPKITVTSLNKMPFAKIPPFCIQVEDSLVCDLNHGKPIDDGCKAILTIAYDVSNVNGTSIVLSANASSSGDEMDSSDNTSNDEIMLLEMFSIDGNVETNSEDDSIADTETLENYYEVKNNGPGSAQELLVILEIPTAYTSTKITIVRMDDINLKAVHNTQNLTYEWEVNSDDFVSHYSAAENSSRKIFFRCDSSGTVTCTRAIIKVKSLLLNDGLLITLKYEPGLKQINKLLTKGKSHFVFETKLRVFKVNRNRTEILDKILYNSIWKKTGESVPIIVIIMSSVGGILILLVISLCMFKFGFFERRIVDGLDIGLTKLEEIPIPSGHTNPVFNAE